ncbi:MAG: dihydrofolate reductase family protein [Candidatus Nanopelagicales bacterium]
MSSRVVLYAAISLDGYLADPDGGVGWLDQFDPGDLGYERFLAAVGSLVMGRATYDQVRTFGEWPYPGRRTAVLTHRPLDDDVPPDVEAWDGTDPLSCLDRLNAASPGDVWIVGGAQTLRLFLDEDLVEETEVFVMPLLLRAGIPLWEQSTYGRLQRWDLVAAEAHDHGVVRLHHRRRR